MKRYLSYLWHITAGFHRVTILRTLVGIVRVGIILAVIWLSKTAVDCATARTPAPVATLVLWFSLLGVGMLVDMVLARWVNYVENRSYTLMNNRVSRRLYNILLATPPANDLHGFHSGDMLNRLTLDVRTISRFALSQLPTMIVLLVQIVASFIFLAWLNPWLALAPVVVMPICLLASKLYFRRQRRITADIRDNESRMHVSIQEGLRHRLLLRSLESQEEMDRRLGSITATLDDLNRTQTLLSTRSSTLVRLGFITGYLAAFGWSIFSLRAGVITFGTMTAFIQLVNRIQHPIAGISGYLPAFINTSVAMDRLREIDLPLADAEQADPLPHAGVRVEDVSFRYREDGEDVLSRFSHDFRPGSRTMIVGQTGAGKTTLIKLLLGLLTPQSGRIEVYNDKGERQTVGTPTLSNFVYVPQGNSLLQGTIRENLLLADPEASEEDMERVLHTAAAEFVYGLPAGLDTPCDESGTGLSEGQAQRIAIARALLRPGSILLLDEFNSALDAATAATLMERLAADTHGSTVIIIAHHQSAVLPYVDATLRIS